MKTTWRLSLLLIALPLHLGAQDSVRFELGALQHDALRRDPRAREIDLLAAQSALRLRSIEAERLPALGVNGQAQYQSAVATIPILLPGVDIPKPPHDTYDAHLSARQKLFDPAIGGRRNVERAQLAESQARVQSSLFAVRSSVNDAYFNALELQLQRREIDIAIADLEAQLRLATNRVREGASLPSEARVLEAELLRRRQSVATLIANRDAALAVLGSLTGREIPSTAQLALPDLGRETERARGSITGLKSRPEYDVFSRTRDLLDTQRSLVAARELPRISAFGRAGYGRPGLNPLASKLDAYWLAGIQLEWSPWTWGAAQRDREVLSLQQQIVDRQEASFAENVSRATGRDIATIDRLAESVEQDDAIVALREQILAEARIRFTEGVITSAEYVDRQTDVLAARVTRDAHRIELAQARARLLTTLGLEISQ
ncbi:MAG: TolC family protein [Gemmatimonadaceae bacterium]